MLVVTKAPLLNWESVLTIVGSLIGGAFVTLTLDEVKNRFGGQKGLAAALGISRQAISQWEGQVPEARAYQIVVLSQQPDICSEQMSLDDLPVRGRAVA